MKHLPKHLRPRWRYLALALESWPDTTLTRRTFQRTLWYAGQNLLGDPGSADADLTVIRFQFEAGVGAAIVRVRHGHVEAARGAIACVDAVGETPVGVSVRGVSGTIRACEEKYLRSRGQVCPERNVVFDDADRVAFVRTDSGDVDVQLENGYVGATDLDIG